MNDKIQHWVNWILYDELMECKINAPKHLLGNHDYGEGQMITTYKPHSVNCKVISPTGKLEYDMERVDDRGFYALYLPKKKFNGSKYRLVTQYQDGSTVTSADPYSFESQLSEFDIYLFSEGNHWDIYKKLGAHPMKVDGVSGTFFAVWAPHARRVSVVGDFNMWDRALHPMNISKNAGFFELFIPDVTEDAVYKFNILTRYGEEIYKSDPFGNCAQFRPDNASVVKDITKYRWKDTDWMEQRSGTTRTDLMRKPMTIYEMHLGSWKKRIEEDVNGFFNYRDLAHMVADYVKEMGYTHIELMGIAEYPFDGSWGYQVTNYYAPTRRYGDPEDFMYFVDYMHKNKIGVILDWVPAHFPRDAHGLGRFDGMPLFEHPDSRRGEHPDWGTYIFDFGRSEVSNFLIANAIFWIREYHIDALRVDAVASMLYLDYGRRGGDWLPNEDGGNENHAAIAMLRKLNKTIEDLDMGAFVIAEESTSWAGVTSPVALDGLGFLFKWNMGWMNDFLEYMKLDPYFRQFNHNRLTFSLMYAYSENFVLVFSHDEVVHLKCSMLNKMSGLHDDKFANLRTAYGFMYGHPGKKLVFMGQEFAQLREWSEERSLDWFLLDSEDARSHRGIQNYVKALNQIYNKYDAMYYNDQDPMGFEWISCDDAQSSIVSFIRRGSTPKNQLLFVCNFTPIDREDFIVGVPCKGKYTEILNSDAEQYGGQNRVNPEPIKALEKPWDNKQHSITLHLPPLSVVVLKYDYKDPEAPKAATKRTKTTTAKRTGATRTTAKRSTAKRTAATKNESVVEETGGTE
ncbi:MAG: 1,4-alpha-glucan branching protein GlgB [Lachnospiraceae bacterium]|nr:1,4-alpha-glucan branching protein GlgB [Lachnospiraceae bacterium]